MNLFSKKDDSLIAVDLSSTAIKMLELSKSRSGYELKSMAIVPLPRDAIVENTVIDSMAVSQALLDAIDVARPSSRRIAFAISGNSVIIKTAQVANMSEFEFESEVEFEADQHVPYDIDDVYLDFQILGPTKEDPEMMDVVLVACKREVVDDYQLVMGEAGLETTCVDCAVFALENASELMGTTEVDMVESFEEEAEYAVALINIGANLININILKNGRMAFVRDQFYGGVNLTEEIQKEHVIGFQAAEDMKIKRFQEISSEAVERFYMGLTSEIVRSLDFYAANNAESPVQALYLSGGGALIPNITEELSQRLGIEAHLVNPFSVIKVNPKKFDLAYLERIGPMMMVPVGLALRSFDE
ncbi:MAG: pilus assembly protein PilM [Zetaproteobacteria bacterium CG_4_9_14_3_um_filter_49_83]|nr:MAG: pilus assembly protein PilM [Zetaproteobacteria bacterium CG1_02_49_23]PIQ30005.1 MAG: pilus assembly protein PilM [Zetaproteobacteria bacterium CG17_big_fil_post_rev_8_21_14_2_50_50_13]PIV30375.1 MAG: pilus assembly protein PilM [Zetaproteobacteria bacterium CG02_land_8_20_14_3_00_50_9]PIY56047.1 MAG: pilus assembly protein PilM [Zetaproteobacteria bacterium CG_4_10_14_0_8_um_filter_49_80]PJA36277.1 MAG: pilus assembly protein PilM [Zetaproteobacteria bacterium CG_4_9_14_3_um_filter_49